MGSGRQGHEAGHHTEINQTLWEKKVQTASLHLSSPSCQLCLANSYSVLEAQPQTLHFWEAELILAFLRL